MFLLDANVFIQAKNEYYHPDVVPGFWTWIEKKHKDGVAFSVSSVFDELNKREDEVSDWANRMPNEFFLEPDEKAFKSMLLVSTWAVSGQYRDTAIQDFLGAADYVLVAYAHAHGCTVVSQEVAAPEAIKIIKIPDACSHFSVPHVHTFDWIKDECARF